MFRNVLVGVDGSASATHALAEAIEIARASGGRLGLLSVAASPSRGIALALPPSVSPVSQAQLSAQLQAKAQRNLDEAERSVPADMPVTKLLSHGSVVRALLTRTHDGPWDLIVVGHRRAADRWPLRQSVGTRLLRASPVPVLVVSSASKPTPRRPRRLPIMARGWRHHFRRFRRWAVARSCSSYGPRGGAARA
jgi:nucleotide-binding universal stress UspA family protein